MIMVFHLCFINISFLILTIFACLGYLLYWSFIKFVLQIFDVIW